MKYNDLHSLLAIRDFMIEFQECSNNWNSDIDHHLKHLDNDHHSENAKSHFDDIKADLGDMRVKLNQAGGEKLFLQSSPKVRSLWKETSSLLVSQFEVEVQNKLSHEVAGFA